MSAGLVAMGVFGAAHGVKGEIRLKSHTGEPLAIAGYGPLSDKTGRIFEIISARPVKDDMLVVRVKGVDDRNAAERLTHVELYAPRDVLGAAGEDEFFHADLVGLRAETEAGVELGRVSGVFDFGAGDLVEVVSPAGGQAALYPFTKAVVTRIDVSGGRLVIAPPVEVEADGEARGDIRGDIRAERRGASAAPNAAGPRRRRGI